MLISDFTMVDLGIMAGTALAGGLIIDLNRRLTAGQLNLAGLVLVALGWAATLCMAATGPLPHIVGAAIGMGLLLTGIALLLPALMRADRERRRG